MIIKLSEPSLIPFYTDLERGVNIVNDNLRKVSLYYSMANLQYNKSIFYFILNQVHETDTKTVNEAVSN